jgi:hypothetical protein
MIMAGPHAAINENDCPSNQPRAVASFICADLCQTRQDPNSATPESEEPVRSEPTSQCLGPCKFRQRLEVSSISWGEVELLGTLEN